MALSGCHRAIYRLEQLDFLEKDQGGPSGLLCDGFHASSLSAGRRCLPVGGVAGRDAEHVPAPEASASGDGVVATRSTNRVLHNTQPRMFGDEFAGQTGHVHVAACRGSAVSAMKGGRHRRACPAVQIPVGVCAALQGLTAGVLGVLCNTGIRGGEPSLKLLGCPAIYLVSRGDAEPQQSPTAKLGRACESVPA